ncbi:hypothetical protein [Anthocerotibacter panamensis]|uniref:hypothetical protein n=1 Tax=Anthocerotibacter panamensis TaxID=2857077 RepID=UPI001C4063FC|nr:hypothetical protein [Anthocerotibacter panamensis]
MVRLLQERRKDILPLFVLATFISQVFVILLLMFQGTLINQLSRKAPPTLVQLVDGQAVQVGPMDHLERTPEIVRRFVGETMSLMMNWSGTLPPETVEESKVPKPDPGVGIGGKRIATATWQAGFALSEDFRRPFMETLAQLTPPEVFGNGTQVVLVVRNIGNPEKIGEGRWRVAMVANVVVFRKDQDSLGKAIPFNKDIYVRAVEASPTLENTTPLQKAIYRIRQSGLEIYAIRELEQGGLQ